MASIRTLKNNESTKRIASLASRKCQQIFPQWKDGRRNSSFCKRLCYKSKSEMQAPCCSTFSMVNRQGRQCLYTALSNTSLPLRNSTNRISMTSWINYRQDNYIDRLSSTPTSRHIDDVMNTSYSSSHPSPPLSPDITHSCQCSNRANIKWLTWHLKGQSFVVLTWVTHLSHTFLPRFEASEVILDEVGGVEFPNGHIGVV